MTNFLDQSTESTPPPLFSARAVSAATIPIWILAIIAIGVVLKAAQSVVIPLVIAWLLAYVLAPPVNFLTRRCRVPSALSVTFVLVVLVALAIYAGTIVQQRLFTFAQKLPAYAPRLAALIADYAARLDLPPGALDGIDIQSAVTSSLLRLTRALFSFGYNALLVIIFLFFMLLARPYASDKLLAAFPGRSAAISSLLATISSQIAIYLGSLFIVSLLTGLAFWAALILMGVDFAFTWGLLAFTLNFVPTLGSIVATILPSVTALVQFGGALGPTLMVASVLTIIQFLLGTLVAPKLYGDRLNLSPVTVLLFLLFWGWLWGIPGVLLAVPLAATVQITMVHIPFLTSLAILMGSSKHHARSLLRRRHRRRHASPSPEPDAPTDDDLLFAPATDDLSPDDVIRDTPPPPDTPSSSRRRKKKKKKKAAVPMVPPGTPGSLSPFSSLFPSPPPAPEPPAPSVPEAPEAPAVPATPPPEPPAPEAPSGQPASCSPPPSP